MHHKPLAIDDTGSIRSRKRTWPYVWNPPSLASSRKAKCAPTTWAATPPRSTWPKPSPITPVRDQKIDIFQCCPPCEEHPATRLEQDPSRGTHISPTATFSNARTIESYFDFFLLALSRWCHAAFSRSDSKI